METFDHIVIGGGVLGLSIAYHLARDSGESVLVVERNELASAASSKAAGLILQSTGKAPQTPMVRLTRETVAQLEEDLGETIGFHDVGSLRIAASSAREAELRGMERDAESHGIPFQHLSQHDARIKAPWLNSTVAHRITLFPTDGYVDPYMLSTAYGRAARKFGAHIRTRIAVNDLIRISDRVTGVRTASGDVSGGSVIDAAGAWASLISARAGYPLPMAPTRSHYWITAADASYGDQFPVTLLPDCRAYMRPDTGAMVIGVQEANSATFDARQLPDDINTFSPTPGEEHWDIIAEAMESISAFFPAIARARFANYISGLSTYTPDGTVLLGAVPGSSNFFTAAGCCGNGIALSAGIGSAISALVRGNEPVFDITPFAPGRFGSLDPFSREFRDRCSAARACKSHSTPAS
ncbi:NAD(P)/FAD-dependent oxidoreductase [Anderseniella sp. Alg231-50]|uniref:NAD(P)/FAD-dependent oxidoreductase n=1 Tax=Anderseniella sp. Alg231-50 TaxID=1922226 RepID=UPI00307CB1C8